MNNHRKKDRLFRLAAAQRLPLVLFADGGGGRPGDDWIGAGFEGMAFRLFGELSGLVPLVGIAGGPSFAGNASLLGCCDAIIATDHSNLGMAGPAMIEGGGLGRVAPEEIGPIDVSTASRCRRRARRRRGGSGARSPKQYLSYFAGPRRLGVRRPAAAPPRDPREPGAGLRRACADRAARRHRLGAGAAAASSAPGSSPR